MRDSDVDSQLAGEVFQVLLEDVGAAAIAPAAIAKDEDRLCPLVPCSSDGEPPVLDADAGELGSVLAGAHGDEAKLGLDVVNAVRDGQTGVLRGEVVVRGLLRLGSVDPVVGP